MFQEAYHTYSKDNSHNSCFSYISHIAHKAIKIGVTHSAIVASKLASAPALCHDSNLQPLVKVILLGYYLLDAFTLDMNVFHECMIQFLAFKLVISFITCTS